MQKQMKLKGQIRLCPERTFSFISSHYDGTPFELPVDLHDVQLNEDLFDDKPVVDGWLYVLVEAQQHDRCYLTLPKPANLYGHQVTVKDLQLMPRDLSLEHFRPQKMGGEDKAQNAKVHAQLLKHVEVTTAAENKKLRKKQASQA